MSRLFKERFEASFFIVEDNDSFAEIITSSMTMKALKKRCEELKARLQVKEIICYDSSYASSLMTMLMIMLMTILRAIVDRSSLEYRLVSKSTLFRISLCSSESYR